MYSTDSAVAQSNHTNSEGCIQTFTQENQVKQQNFSQKVQLEVLWLQLGCGILYLDHGCTNFPKIYKKTQNFTARVLT
jgi:hypothetical protein